MTTEVDLLDQDGVIVSVGAADDAFWAANASWVAYMAQQRGLTVYVPGGAPQPGSAERNITSIADAQNWIGTAQVSVKKPTASSSTTTKWVVGGLIASAVLAAIAVVVSDR